MRAYGRDHLNRRLFCHYRHQWRLCHQRSDYRHIYPHAQQDRLQLRTGLALSLRAAGCVRAGFRGIPLAYSISGRVTDSAENPVSGVTVTAYPNAATGAVKILKVTADHDLAGYYPVGLGAVEVWMTVNVDWGGKAPGRVRYVFNDAAAVDDSIVGSVSSRAFRFDQRLRPGSNTLTIKAIAVDGAESAPRALSTDRLVCPTGLVGTDR